MKRDIDFEKMSDDFNIVTLPDRDDDGSITGEHIFGLRCWMNENPDRQIELGWIKHIHPEMPPYDEQTEYVETTPSRVDDYTIIDTYAVLPKTEAMMAAQELSLYRGWFFA